MQGAGGKDPRKRGKNTFKPGNPGKPKGAISQVKKDIAKVARQLMAGHAPTHFKKLFEDDNPSVPLMAIRQRAIEWMADRGYGKAAQVVRLGSAIDPNSPEGVMLMIAGQTIPTANESDDDDDDEGNADDGV